MPKFNVELKGLLLHGGLASAFTLLGLALPATLCYLAYQLLDYASGEDAREAKGDIAEWMAGLLLGALAKLAAGWT